MARIEIKETSERLIVKITGTREETLTGLEDRAEKLREAVVKEAKAVAKEQKEKKMYFEISSVMQRHVLYVFFVKMQDLVAREEMKEVIKNCWIVTNKYLKEV